MKATPAFIWLRLPGFCTIMLCSPCLLSYLRSGFSHSRTYQHWLTYISGNRIEAALQQPSNSLACGAGQLQAVVIRPAEEEAPEARAAALGMVNRVLQVKEKGTWRDITVVKYLTDVRQHRIQYADEGKTRVRCIWSGIISRKQPSTK